MKKNFWIFLMFISINIFAQTEDELVERTIMNYIEGTSFNRTEQIKKAFYAEANLYLTNKDNGLWVLPSNEYVGFFEKGERNKFNGRVGEIISIDRENDVAIAKAEILVPKKNIRFVDVFLLKKVNSEWKIMSKSATKEESSKHGNKVLFIVSNAHFYGNSKLKTGNSFSEITNAYHAFNEAGYNIDFMSPHGGAIPVAYLNTSDSLQKKYFYDSGFISSIRNTKKPEDIKPSEYKAVYYVGGGSAMFEVPMDKRIQKIAMKVYEEYNGVIASVCHGTAGIVNLKTKDGNYLVKEKLVSGYPENYERKDAEYFKTFPFLIKKTIEKRGGKFMVSPKGESHVEVDGRLVTGQNHLSSSEVALRVIELIENKTVK